MHKTTSETLQNNRGKIAYTQKHSFVIGTRHVFSLLLRTTNLATL